MDDLEQLRLLGRGAMGSVHLMRRAADGAQFALKKIAIPTHEDREVALQEVRICSGCGTRTSCASRTQQHHQQRASCTS